MDAPSHFAEGRWRIGQVPFERLIGPGVLVDIEERAKFVISFCENCLIESYNKIVNNYIKY